MTGIYPQGSKMLPEADKAPGMKPGDNRIANAAKIE